jgi:uncharacterized circularly permuted ATP-grasp superfamily protein/uncharacterized alpha-E superfamily protein
MSLLRDYRPTGGRYDTAIDPRGAARPGWAEVVADVDRLGLAELVRRQKAADRLVEAEGAGVLLHDDTGDAGDDTGPARVAILPLVLGTDMWRALAAGLAQRAELLRAVWRDLCGPGELLRAGVVPVEAVATHPAFPLTPVAPGSDLEQPLLLVGADVVIDAEGHCRVVRDVTDVVGGDGHALLARSILGRVLPSSRQPVELAGHETYTRDLRAALALAAPPGRRSPRTVLLTGPPGEPGYVENAYLATQLGYSLAEHDDVVVRGGRTWLRSLDGPEPIDVLLRRVPESALDPVESPHLGTAGVAGLVEAARDHSVTLVNPYGAGIVAHPGLQPFLDAACRFLLGRPLLLPSVPTLWCGDPEHLAEVRAAPDRFVLHDTSPPGPASSRLPADRLPNDWLRRIEAQPERYVAQLEVPLATTPCLVDGTVQGRPVALRTQVLLAGAAPVVLPGGHGRVIGDDGYSDTTGHAGYGGYGGGGPADGVRPGHTGVDVWVMDIDRTRRDPTSGGRAAAAAIPQVDLRRSLPTRAAEAMYWTGRTAERAEMGTRTALVCLTRVLNGEPRPADLLAMVDGLRAVSGGMLGPPVEATPFDLEAEVRAALGGRPASVVGNLRSMVATARAARPLLSGRTWRLLAMLDAEATALEKLTDQPGLAAFDATEVLDRVLVPLAALAGLSSESVMRTAAWRFLDVGRRLERALLVLGLLEATLDPRTADGTPDPLGASVPWDPLDPVDPGDPREGSLRLEATLAACESLVAYRRSFRSDVTRAAVANLLLADPANPRSVRFQLDQLAVDLNDLPDRPVRRQQMAALRRAARMLDDHAAAGIGPLVLAVRAPLLEIGELMAGGWFGQPHRQVR